jgi:hypothetical protein
MALYCAVETVAFVVALNAGAGLGGAVLAARSEVDQVLWAGLLNFWFVERVIDRGTARQLSRWVHGSGKVLPGPVCRREAEEALLKASQRHMHCQWCIGRTSSTSV